VSLLTVRNILNTDVKINFEIDDAIDIQPQQQIILFFKIALLYNYRYFLRAPSYKIKIKNTQYYATGS